ASRCHRVGFLQQGQLLIEGTPSEIVSRLEGRVIELIGRPRRLLKRLASEDPQVQNAHSFGDRLHLRVAAGSAEAVMQRLAAAIAAQDGSIEQIHPVKPGLEDVFLDLLENTLAT
ncbi:MAG: DUF4162 domain-containing protein, partial [Anaerolineales bacterium]